MTLYPKFNLLQNAVYCQVSTFGHTIDSSIKKYSDAMNLNTGETLQNNVNTKKSMLYY